MKTNGFFGPGPVQCPSVSLCVFLLVASTLMDVAEYYYYYCCITTTLIFILIRCCCCHSVRSLTGLLRGRIISLARGGG